MGAAEEANRLNEENARLRDEIDKVLRERDEARAAEEHLRGQHQYSIGLSMALEEREKAIRERDLALGRLENEIKAANQARMAEERARESLDELDAAIYECLPSDYDDDSPLDCVEHAADRLRDLAQERDEHKAKREEYAAEARSLRERLKDAYRERDEARAELAKLREDYDSVLEANVSLLDGAPYVDARNAIRERDEVRAEVDRLRETIKLTWATCGCCKCTVCKLSKDALHPKKTRAK